MDLDWWEIWNSNNDEIWKKCEDCYDICVKESNKALEKELEQFDVNDICKWTSNDFYDFLYSKYFVWKYTAPNRLETTRSHLSKMSQPEKSFLLEALKIFKDEVIKTDEYNKDVIKLGFKIVSMIPGLGMAGSSGLLAVMFPYYYGTVDQFVVYSLEEAGVETNVTHPDGISLDEAVVLEQIMYKKALEMNRVNNTEYWTPRKVDKILWAHRSQKSV